MIRQTAAVLGLLAGLAWNAPGFAADAEDIAAAKAWLAGAMPGVPAETVDAAAKEGEVMLYHLNYPNGVDGVFSAFRARFPFITVREFTASGGPLFERFRTEASAGRAGADLWQHTSIASARQLADAGYLMNWTPPNDAAFPDRWKQAGCIYPIGVYHMVLAWNTEIIGKADAARLETLKTWDDFLAAEWQETLGLVHVRAGGTMHLAYYFLWKEYDKRFLQSLADYKPLIFDSIVPLAERLAAGEIGMVPMALDTGVSPQWGRGAPVRWAYLEPSLASVYVQAIAANAPHPNAARLFQAWSLSPEGLAAWVEASDLAPVLPGVEDRRKVAKQPWYRLPKRYYDFSFDEVAKELPNIFKAYEQTLH